MGARQSKRSVDITTTPKTSKSAPGEGTIIVEENSQGGDNVKVENIKVEESKLSDLEQAGTVVVTDTEIAEDKDKIEDVEKKENEKEKEKEKVKKKWSFRSISFSRKDKNKPVREKVPKNGDISKEDVTESREETPAIETPKAVSEAAADLEKRDADSASPVKESADETKSKDDSVTEKTEVAVPVVPVVSNEVKTDATEVEKPVEVSAPVIDTTIVEEVSVSVKNSEDTVASATLVEPEAKSAIENVATKLADEFVKDTETVLEKVEEKVEEILSTPVNTAPTNNVNTEVNEIHEVCTMKNDDSPIAKEEIVEKTVVPEEPIPEAVQVITEDANNIEDDLDVLPPPLPESPAPVHTEASKIANFAESTMEQKDFPSPLPAVENNQNCTDITETTEVPSEVSQENNYEDSPKSNDLSVELTTSSNDSPLELSMRLAESLGAVVLSNDQSTELKENNQVDADHEIAVENITLHQISLSENNIEEPIKTPAPVITEDVTSVTKAIEEITISEKAVAAAVDETIKNTNINEVAVDTVHQNTMNE